MRKSMSINTFIRILASSVVINSCKKEDAQPVNQPGVNNPQPAPVKGIAPFSGTWTGGIKVDDLYPDLCHFAGDPISTTQEWFVDIDSSLTIIETAFDFNSRNPSTTTWTGRLHEQDSVSVTMSKNINCFGVSQIMTTELKAKIVKAQDNKYIITATVDYPMCPPDCWFTFNYSIKKNV